MAKALQDRLLNQKKKTNDEVSEYMRILTDIQKYSEELEVKESNWIRLESIMKENFDKAENTVKLNVRGKMYETMKENLVRIEATYFHGLISSGSWMPGKDGAYFIDRRSEGFDRILDYLATGNLSYSDLTKYECEVIVDNLEYFLLKDAPRPPSPSPPTPTYRQCNLTHAASQFAGASCKKQVLHASKEIFGQYKICPKCSSQCSGQDSFHYE